MNRRLVVSYVVLVAVAIAAFTLPVAFTLTAQLRGDVELSARREAQAAALLLAKGDGPSREALAKLSQAYAEQTPGRMDAVLADRTPVTPAPVSLDDPALLSALSGRESAQWNDAPAIDGDGFEVAIPAHDGSGRVVGAVRISYPSAPLEERQWRIWGFRAALGLLVLGVAAFLGVLLARRLTRPFRSLNRMASRLRDGDLTARAEEEGPTETRTLANTLNNAADTIDTLVRAQRSFIADASHQLRTPLTALRLALDNIADGVDDPIVREDVDQATAEVVRMSRMVNGLLTLARAEVAVGQPEPVWLAEVVAERCGVWRAAAQERGVDLRQSHGDPAIAALASPGHLEQVLDNVLSNAIEVSPEGGVITVSSARSGDGVVLEVSDEGPGLSEADRARAFDRFWRGHGHTGPSGSGLGLAIVRQLVTDDGGRVALAEAAGGGLLVRVTLRAGPASRTSGG